MLLAFGSLAVSMMFLAYWQEPRSKWFTLLLALGSAAAAAYGWLVAAYPFTVVEGVWFLVAFQRFWSRYRQENRPSYK